jgi:hypothetical protein
MDYDSSTQITEATEALIFQSGQADSVGRTWPLAVFGRTHDGRSITAQRNVQPSLHAVAAVLASCEASGMTHLTVGADLCG